MVVIDDANRAGTLTCHLPDESIGQWYVLHTRARQEKVLARDLSAMELKCFLPLGREPRQYGQCRVIVETPLFPSVVFMRGGPDDVGRADRTCRVARVEPVEDQTRLDWELRNVCCALRGQAQLDPHPYRDHRTRVEVRSGPLRGLQGFVEDHRAMNPLILQVQALGKAVSVELAGALLERVN